MELHMGGTAEIIRAMEACSVKPSSSSDKSRASKSRQQAIKQATHFAFCSKRRHDIQVAAHRGEKAPCYRQRLTIAGKKTSRGVAHNGTFSPLSPAESAPKVSPFCHIEQQINAKTTSEPSQISRDSKAFRAIPRRATA
jgi:hypothetical protein